VVTDHDPDERPWSRAVEPFARTFDELDRFLDTLLKGERLAGFETLGGGRANTNLLLRRPHGDDMVLRIYQRDPTQREKEVAVISRLWGKVPVPEIIVHGEDSGVLHVPYVLMYRVEGDRIEQRFSALDRSERLALGLELGRILAAVHAHRFDQSGFFNDALEVATPLSGGSAGLLDVVDMLLEQPDVTDRLGTARCSTLRGHVAAHAGALDAWPDSASLAHGDFGFSNILIAGAGEGLKVTAVLDWEFAMAATPLLDFGNLIRPPGGDDPDFMTGLEQGYREVDPTLPEDWTDLARTMDLLAWIDFAGRPDAPEDLLEHARMMIDRITT
jgi:aminoglycoside phosphotransferase (APT) family kinase protein